jgi:hypothetical protein
MHLHEVIFQLPEVLKQEEQCVKYLSLAELRLFEICSTTVNFIAMTRPAPRQSLLPPSSKGFFRAHREQEAQKWETAKVEEELAPIVCANEAAALAESPIKE